MNPKMTAKAKQWKQVQVMEGTTAGITQKLLARNLPDEFRVFTFMFDPKFEILSSIQDCIPPKKVRVTVEVLSE